MFYAILLIGFLALVIALKIAKGIIKIGLVILILLIVGGVLATRDDAPVPVEPTPVNDAG